MRTQLCRTMIAVLSVSFLGTVPVFAQEKLEEVTLLVVKGDPVSGKRNFQDLLCTSCHRVAKEKTFPSPIAGYEGPIISSRQAAMTIKDLSASILTPSHKIPQEVRRHIYGDKSPMTDYSDAITVRQLMDIIAYIRSLK